MKTMGLIGGMSWESTAIYYRLINEGVKRRLGGHHSAKLMLYSVDFAEIEVLQRANRWEESGILLADAARALQHAGAEFIVLCTNTMHIVAPAIEKATTVPLLHIADPTAEAIKASGVNCIALLGTKFTMEHEFYVDRLRKQHGLRVLLPNAEERGEIHRTVYEELVHGKVVASSKQRYLQIIDRLNREGAQGVILGCTEITLLIQPGDSAIPYFDTTELHAGSAVAASLAV